MGRIKTRDLYSDIVFYKIIGERHREIKQEEKQISLEERRRKLREFVDRLKSIFSKEDSFVLEDIQVTLISNWLKYNNKDVSHAIIQVEPYMDRCTSTTQDNWASLKKEFNSVF